jgi:uncharacterized protein
VLYVLALLLILMLVFGPSLWIKHVMNKHGGELSEMPGTGGELAKHLVERFNLENVEVEETNAGDHYDSAEKAVRLSPAVYKRKSLTAVAVAAHEVGHAIQYHRKENITHLRQRFTPLAMVIERLAIGTLIAAPLIAAVLKTPHVALITAVAGAVGILASVLVQFIILPMEWDASFNKALPILVEGQYISPEQIPAVKSILKAAAFTYVAATLASILRLGRWLAILRGGLR